MPTLRLHPVQNRSFPNKKETNALAYCFSALNDEEEEEEKSRSTSDTWVQLYKTFYGRNL